MPYKHRQVTPTTQGATSSEAVCISQEGTKAADLDRKICKLSVNSDTSCSKNRGEVGT